MNARIKSTLIAVGTAGAIATLVSCDEMANIPTGIEIDADDIGGVVTSAAGPEAGVWVIAETTDLPTRFTRIVATDDAGRYVLPWIREGVHQPGCLLRSQV